MPSATLHAQQCHSTRDDGAPNICDLTAAYTAGIVRNYPCMDGNKRTDVVVGILFLELHGYRFTASENAATQAVWEWMQVQEAYP